MQLDALQAENRELRRRLAGAGLMREDEKIDRGGRRPVYAQQPAVLLWKTHSPQLECTQPLPPMIVVFLLVLLLGLCLQRRLSRYLSWSHDNNETRVAGVQTSLHCARWVSGCTMPTCQKRAIPTTATWVRIAENPPRRFMSHTV